MDIASGHFVYPHTAIKRLAQCWYVEASPKLSDTPNLTGLGGKPLQDLCKPMIVLLAFTALMIIDVLSMLLQGLI